MLQELYYLLSERFRVSLSVLAQSISIQLLAFVFSISFVWRLWSFTVQPALQPNAPKPLPYWVPGQSSPMMGFK